MELELMGCDNCLFCLNGALKTRSLGLVRGRQELERRVLPAGFDVFRKARFVFGVSVVRNASARALVVVFRQQRQDEKIQFRFRGSFPRLGGTV